MTSYLIDNEINLAHFQSGAFLNSHRVVTQITDDNLGPYSDLSHTHTEIVPYLFEDNASNMDDMEEADEMLMKLWRQGEKDFKTLRRRLGETQDRAPPASAR